MQADARLVQNVKHADKRRADLCRIDTLRSRPLNVPLSRSSVDSQARHCAKSSRARFLMIQAIFCSIPNLKDFKKNHPLFPRDKIAKS